jgi:hypothetical protein
MPCLENRPLISDRRLLLLRLAEFERTMQASALEQRQADRGSDCVLAEVPNPEPRRLQRLNVEAAGQCDAGIEIGNRDADIGGGLVQSRLRRSDIRRRCSANSEGKPIGMLVGTSVIGFGPSFAASARGGAPTMKFRALTCCASCFSSAGKLARIEATCAAALATSRLVAALFAN